MNLNQKLTRVKIVFSRTLYSQSAASVSMGSLAAYLRQSGFQTDLCLLNETVLHGADTILGDSTENNVVIAKPNFKDFNVVLSLLERLKSVNMVKRVFLCGPFAKLNASGIMSNLVWLDGIFIDQLEPSAARLLSTMSGDLSSWNTASPGVISRDPQTNVVCNHVPLLTQISLSDLPFPARDIEMKENVGFVNLEASRGCLFNCSFCHIPLMSENPEDPRLLNFRNPSLVVDEMQRLNRGMGKTLFIFNDSCFWSTKKDDARVLLFCSEIRRRKLDIHFYIYLKGEPFIGDDVLHALVEAGLVRVFLGVENSVESSLTVYRKKIRAGLYETVKAKFDPLGVNIHIGYITIEPHSSLTDIRSNVEYLFRIGKLFRLGVILEPVRVVPETSLHKQLLAEGLMPFGLNYDEITYGYKFVHEEAGHLLAGWKKMFCEHLGGIAYGFEYHSTTGELLKVFAGRFDQKFVLLLKESYEKFNAKRLEIMKIVLDYLRASIELAGTGKCELVGDSEYNTVFITKFTEASGELGVLYARLSSIIRQNGGERIIREIYIG